jgi:outer membrane lipoprotein carrier protein
MVAATGTIEKMRIEETDGSVTEFTFAAAHEGLDIPNSTFRFTPPAGVEVVDGLAPI